MPFRTISEPLEIRKVIDNAMNTRKMIPCICVQQGSDWNGVTITGEHWIEGSVPIAATESSSVRKYTLSNSDSNYTAGIGMVTLSEIKEIWL